MACGRLGDPPTIRFADEPLPLYRFLEQTRFTIPGVELIADSEVSLRNDPYLIDHAFSGEPLLPAVVGLEAMTQVAQTVSGKTALRIDNVELLHPVTLATMRVAALRVGGLVGERVARASGTPVGGGAPGGAHHSEDVVDIAIRSSSTQFHLDHFRARVVVGTRGERARLTIPGGAVTH